MATTFETMTRRQKSTLLYAESCAVDRRGELDARKINQEDINILIAFDEEGLIDYREISGFVRLTRRAMALAAQCRLERAGEAVLSPEAEACLRDMRGAA